MPRSNIDQLTTAAKLLRPLLGELVFIGGAVTGLLVTDNAAAEPRATLDVDAIAAIASYAEYSAFGERLRALGFSEDSREGAPVCRWIHQGLILDVMPLDGRVLGFSNRWYRAAMETATRHPLSRGLAIRMITAPVFVATKFEAFHGRGQGDFLASHDLEDIVSIVDGRPALVQEIENQPVELNSYIRTEVSALLSAPRFLDALPGYLLPDAVSQSRLTVVVERLRQLASLPEKYRYSGSP